MKIISIKLLIHHVLFTIPYIMDYVVVISSCFFLQNMYVRFQTLNDVWKCLPANLVPISVQWTHIDIVVLMEDMRLLHAELCDLLKMFTLGYGPMLLSFFISSYINMLLSIYIFIQNDEVNHFRITERVYKQMLTLSIYAQSFTFLMSIITFISFINEKVTQSLFSLFTLIVSKTFTFIHILLFIFNCYIKKLRLSIWLSLKKYIKNTLYIKIIALNTNDMWYY